MGPSISVLDYRAHTKNIEKARQLWSTSHVRQLPKHKATSEKWGTHGFEDARGWPRLPSGQWRQASDSAPGRATVVDRVVLLLTPILRSKNVSNSRPPRPDPRSFARSRSRSIWTTSRKSNGHTMRGGACASSSEKLRSYDNRSSSSEAGKILRNVATKHYVEILGNLGPPRVNLT